MTPQSIQDQIRRLDPTADLAGPSNRLVDAWAASGTGVEAVEPILRFMEQHPSADFGMPGPLVHFVERFHGCGYDEMLLESVRRRPTTHTVWMLNRIINGTKSPSDRNRLIAALEEAARHPLAEHTVIQLVNSLLNRPAR